MTVAPGTGNAGSHEVATLADDVLHLMFEADPLAPTLLGLPGYDDKLRDLSREADEAQRARAVELAGRAEALAERPLDESDAVTVAVAAAQLRGGLAHLDAATPDYTICPTWEGPAGALLSMLPLVVTTNAEQAEGYLARLRAVPGYLDVAIERHRAGLATGRAPVAALVQGAIDQIDRYLADPGNDPFAREQPLPDHPEFAAERDRALTEAVRPAMTRYRDVLAGQFLPAGRPDERPGLCWLDGGDAMYAGLSRAHTTTDRTAEDLHETGLAVIDRLAGEYAEIGARVFGTGELCDIFARLRTDPALRWRDATELLDAARTAVVRAEEQAPHWFGRLPSARCLVEPVPEANGAGAPPAYYVAPSLDGTRPGTYFANTHQAGERFRQLSEATAYHEAVPGHHFQFSIAMELTDLPLLRRLADATAYVEGWGLYCERLAEEMGLYSGDVARLGMLTLDSMRASRLVVDTGLHAKGWSRQQAVTYMIENTPMVPLEIASEVDRYIATPGQALAYMVGRMELERMRGKARELLGDRFDIREFHDRVLGSGPLPLTVLDGVLDRWLRASAS